MMRCDVLVNMYVICALRHCRQTIREGHKLDKSSEVSWGFTNYWSRSKASDCSTACVWSTGDSIPNSRHLCIAMFTSVVMPRWRVFAAAYISPSARDWQLCNIGALRSRRIRLSRKSCQICQTWKPWRKCNLQMITWRLLSSCWFAVTKMDWRASRSNDSHTSPVLP